MIKLGKARFEDAGVQLTYLHGHANIGYGAAHNLVLHGTGADYHLVLNPDVELAPDALADGVRWLDAHRTSARSRRWCATATGSANTCASAIRRCFDLFLRGFAPRFVQRAVPRAGSQRYEMRDVIDVEPAREVIGIPAMSGAFMLVRRARSTRPAASTRASSSTSRTTTGACA